MKLLTESIANTKTAKNDSLGYLSYILHLSPSDLSGFNVCSHASKGCKHACLNTAGRGRFDNVQLARTRKTKMFFEQRQEFLDLLVKDILAAKRKAVKLSLPLTIRLNGTSDISWENIIIKDGLNIFNMFKDVQFYDYTKNWTRIPIIKSLGLTNYSLTFSRSENNEKYALLVLKTGGNVAIVFDKTLPDRWNGYKVINGDKHDLRFLDEKNVVVGLVAKGLAKKDSSNFVIKGA